MSSPLSGSEVAKLGSADLSPRSGGGRLNAGDVAAKGSASGSAPAGGLMPCRELPNTEICTSKHQNKLKLWWWLILHESRCQ